MEKSLDKRFGDVLRSLREEAGKTQEDFSVGRTYLSELERGLKTPTLETIVRLAAELGTTPAHMVELATAIEGPRNESQKPLLPAVLSEGIALASARKGGNASASFIGATPLATVEEAVKAAGVELPHLLAEAARVAFRRSEGRNTRERRQGLGYIVADKRSAATLQYAEDKKTPWSFSPIIARQALAQANISLELADDVLGMNGIPFYELLGTRNLGSFVGAVFAYSLQREMSDRLMVNGHQDGYPDLCALTAEGKKYLARVRAEGMETAKKSWAYYPHGGIEVKTTCGSVPTATKARRKPQIGDQRTLVLTGADWKAHHRETNRLLGLFWDFIDGVPTVLALFYRNDLTEKDWGEVIVPTTDEEPESVETVHEGMEDELTVEVAVGHPIEEAEPKKRKGRTTSVSIMTSASVKRMGKGWVVLPADKQLLAALGKKSIFDLGVADVEPLTSTLPPEAKETLVALDRERQKQLERQAAQSAKPRKPRVPKKK